MPNGPTTHRRRPRPYEFRRRRFKVQAGRLEDEDGIEERSLQYQQLMHRIFDIQRVTL
jgi:hypothetical protein